ncbi:MAG: beta-galactosidase trimerization domain-containing protein [Pirellulales bacterium]|nr:beta-galactosidase trimerization domain-containing protein [Pirellulales bacterium]
MKSLVLPLGPFLSLLSAALALGPDVRDWREVAREETLRIEPDGIRRVGFTLPEAALGRRVVVAFEARSDHPKAAGYNPALALEVNGEVMGLQLGGKPRLLNRPMGWHYGKTRTGLQPGGIEGRLSLISNQGSARWTLAYAPSHEALMASADYAPSDGTDVTRFVIEITDKVNAAGFNYLHVKNEGETVALVCTDLRVLLDSAPAPAGGHDEARLHAIQRRLAEQYLDRPALKRKPSAGREWIHDMDLVDNNYSGSSSFGEIESIEDARPIVKGIRDNGATAIIVSGLHFRYSYTDLWERRILPYMRLLTQAAHEAGLKVIDHYDVPIVFSGGYPFLLQDGRLDWTQRHLRYGTPTFWFCVNNPEFRRHFFDWTRRVQRETGIDGYQIDEVSYAGADFCGCESCRRAFHRETGLELPREPDSPVLFNEASALWQTFKLWRGVALQDFKREFLAEIQRENPAVVLSEYTSTHHHRTGGGGIWPSAFVSYATGTEAMSRVPFDTYHQGFADMRLRTGLADAFDHATWVLWYPLTDSTARFCWALSQATGQAQWHDKGRLPALRDLVTWPHKMRKLDFTTFADVAMVFSEKSKNASQWTGYYHGMESFGWGAALADANVQYHHIQEITVTPELLVRYKVVLLPQMTLIDAENHKALEAYVRQGGKLVVTGETGLLDESARPRADFLLGEMMNVKLDTVLDAPFEVIEPGGRSFRFDKERLLYRYGKRFLAVTPRDPDRSRVAVAFRKDGKDYPGIVESGYGKGRVYSVCGFLGLSNYTGTLEEGQKQFYRTNPAAAALMGRWLRSVLAEDETLVPAGLPPKTLMTSWIRKQGRDEIDVHLVNVQNHERLVDVEIRRREIKFPRIEREISVLLRRHPVASATFHAPDVPEPVPCAVTADERSATITIPAGKMTMYGLLKIKLKDAAP